MAGSHPQHSAVAPHEIDIKTALQQLAISISCNGRLTLPTASATCRRHLERRAWSLLLDLDTAAHQEHMVVDHRAYSNGLAAEQACQDLLQQFRPAEAAKLSQLLETWQRTTHYIPWVPENPQDFNPAPDHVPLTEHQAVLSLLFALRGTCPSPPPQFTALPALGSTAVAEVQQRAEAAVAAAGGNPLPSPVAANLGQDAQLLELLPQPRHAAGDSNSSWVPAAYAATQLLQQVPLDGALSGPVAAADTCKHDQNGFAPAEASAEAYSKVTSLVDGLAAKTRLSTQPYQGASKPLGDIIKGSGSGNYTGRHKQAHLSKQQDMSSSSGKASSGAAGSVEVSRAAAGAEAAVAALAAMQPGVVPLMLLSAEQPGFGDFALLGKTPAQDAAGISRVLDKLSGFHISRDKQKQKQKQQQKQQAVKDAARDSCKQPPRAAAAQVAAEEELVATACLALQGVWSAVGRLWDLAQQQASGNHKSSRPVGLARPASLQHVLVKVLHMSELRLRLQAFLQHFQISSNSSTRDAPANATDAAVLHAFLTAVKEILDMHDAAIQSLQHEQQQQQRQQSKSGRATARLPAMTLLQLTVLLRDMQRQLQQLVECCWCTVDMPTDYECGFASPVYRRASTSTQRLLRPEQNAYNTPAVVSNLNAPDFWGRFSSLASDGRRPHFSKAAAAAEERAAAALPWPAATAAWVKLWGWDPSRWQVQQRFMGGRTLAEHLYAGLLHAGPHTAPLLRHLFSTAVQPVLHNIQSWAFQPDIHAAEAAAAAAATTSLTAAGRPSSSRRAGSKGARISSHSSMHVHDPAQPVTLATATGGVNRPFGAVDKVPAAPVSDATTDAAASELLLQAWHAAQDQAPQCPSFLAGVQQQLTVAGLQLQLLQLLGGTGQQLAQRLGWLAELEQQELREMLGSSSSRGDEHQQQQQSRRESVAFDGGTVSAGSAGLQQDSSGYSGLALLLGSRGVALGGATAATQSAAARDAAAACLPFSLTISQLKDAAGVVADYEAARQSELSAVMSKISGAKAAAAEAERALAATRLQEKAAAEETRRQLQQAAAARKIERKQQLLLEQQEMMAAAAARRAKARTNELAFERSLLKQAAAADHKLALQQVQRELEAAQRLGLQLQLPARQQQLPTVKAGCGDGPAGAAAGTATAAEGGIGVADASAAQLLPSTAVGEQQQHPGLPASQHALPTQQQQETGSPGHKRATWGRPVYDPAPAAGRPSAGCSAAAPPLAVGGSAAAAAAGMPAAGRRSNSTPRVLPGMGSVLNPEQRRSSSSGSAGRPSSSGGLGSRRNSWTGGGLLDGVQNPADDGFGAAAGHKKPAVHSKWGMPVLPDAVAGLPSVQRRPSSAGGSSQAWQQQQQQGSRRRVSRHSRGHSVESMPAAAEVLSTDDVLIDLMADDGLAAPPESSVDITAARGTSVQQQQQQSGATQVDAASNNNPPLITTLEVLVVRPLLAQHRLTTLACWQLLLQEQHLLQKLAAMQSIFFQQQADWVDLFIEGLDSLISPVSDVSSSSGSGQVTVERAGVVGAAAVAKHGVSRVAAQLVLEAALQQSCLAGEAAADRLNVQVDSKRTLPGWGSCRSLAMCATPSNAHSASATDVLVLQYQVPWPVSLLVSQEQQQQYGQIFSVLLRLRRLQQQLTKQWAALNSRPGSSKRRWDTATAAAGSGSSSRTGSRRVSRTDSQAQQQQQQPSAQSVQEPDNLEATAGNEGLDRLQQLRRWHAMALHWVGSLLSTMLSELSGNLWGEFESAVTPQPVSLPDIIEAHARLLAAAQEVCLLPQASSSSSGDGSGSSSATTPTAESRLRKSIGKLSMSMEFGLSASSPRVAAAAAVNGTTVAEVVYQLADAAWLLQQQMQQLLQDMQVQPADDQHAQHEQTSAVGEPQPASSSIGAREGSSSRGLAGMLAQDDDSECWHGVSMAGWKLEGLLKTLKVQLASNRACGVGEALAGLAARLGVHD